MIYIFVTLLLDIFLSFFISLSYQNINLFFPSIMIVSIPVFFHLTRSKKVFFLTLFIIGMIYDTLFSDIFLINTYYYLLFGFLIYIFYEQHDVSLVNILLFFMVGIFLYDIFVFFVLIFTGYSIFSFYDLIYKLERTFLLNFMYLILSVFIFKSRILGLKRCKKR